MTVLNRSEPAASVMKRATPRGKPLPSRLAGIQGLRTIAALLVAVYHIWFGRVSGAVDVFFVVAGYFAIKSFLKMVALPGHREQMRFVKSYWLKTARRIAPSATAVLVATSLVSVWFLPPVNWMQNIRHGFASLLNLENWYLIRSGTNYLEAGSSQSMFQQFWALSLQVQFYIFLPILVYAVIAVSRLFGRKPERTLLISMGAILVASLGFSIHLTRLDQPAAYFHSVTRIWEFMVGGILAIVLTRGLATRWLASALGWVGLIILVSMGAIMDVSSKFPGIVALIPVTAAAAILVSSASICDPRILTNKFLVGFGDSSFAFYLWHWPILIIYRARFDEHVGVMAGLGILFLAAILAYGTTRFFERPFRNSRTLGRSPIGTIVAVSMLFALGSGSLLFWNARAEAVRVLLADDLNEFRAHGTGIGPLFPAPMIARHDLVEAYQNGCHQGQKSADVKACSWSEGLGDFQIAIVGGSHSAQWIDAIREAVHPFGVGVTSITKSACVFGNIHEMEEKFDPSCTEWNEGLMEELLTLKPNLVITVATRAVNGYQTVPKGYQDYFSKLDDEGISVLGIEDNPWFTFDAAECVSRVGQDCEVSPEDVYGDVTPDDFANLENFSFVELRPSLCAEERCGVVDGNILIYRDSNHLTRTWTVLRGTTVTDEVLRLIDEQ